MVHIVYQFKVLRIQNVSDQYTDTVFQSKYICTFPGVIIDLYICMCVQEGGGFLSPTLWIEEACHPKARWSTFKYPPGELFVPLQEFSEPETQSG